MTEISMNYVSQTVDVSWLPSAHMQKCVNVRAYICLMIGFFLRFRMPACSRSCMHASERASLSMCMCAFVTDAKHTLC
jgi:hypothetical protein